MYHIVFAAVETVVFFERKLRICVNKDYCTRKTILK